MRDRGSRLTSRGRMPWHETDAVNERMRFVMSLEKGACSVAEACRAFGISRKTGYKILGRYRELGVDGIRDQSRAPKSHPNQIPLEVESAVLRVRRRHPTWGSKKILAVLARESSDASWPARSTVDALLKRVGLVKPRGPRRRRQPPHGRPTVVASASNDVWSMDYKGHFRVGDGTRCDPLTVNDMFSRASLVCRAMVAPKSDDVRKQLERAFRSFGLPRMMLSDNGPPFASCGLGRLSRLGVWLLRLGIRPVLIEPGRPDQNGRHERFHETLKKETAMPPCATVGAQQASFQRFQKIYNEERPHEALDMRVPAEVYACSPREMPSRLVDHEYASGFEQRRVRTDGAIKWQGSLVFVGEALSGEVVGLRQAVEDVWQLHLGPLCLGVVRDRLVLPFAEIGEPALPG